MFSAVKFLRMFTPDICLFENVVGFQLQGGDDSKSPLDVFVSEIQSQGYMAAVKLVDLNLFHAAARPRWAPLLLLVCHCLEQVRSR